MACMDAWQMWQLPWRRPRDSPRSEETKRGYPRDCRACASPRPQAHGAKEERKTGPMQASQRKTRAAPALLWVRARRARSGCACVGDGAASEPGSTTSGTRRVVASGSAPALHPLPAASPCPFASCFLAGRRSLVPAAACPPGRMPHDGSPLAGPEPGGWSSRAIEWNRIVPSRMRRPRSRGSSELLSRPGGRELAR